MTGARDAPAMHPHTAVALPVLLVLAACASAPAPVTQSQPASAVPALRVLQIHDVRDLVTPPGDEEMVRRLAEQVRDGVTFLLGGTDPGATVTAHGAAIVVYAVPEVQRRVTDYLTHKREGVTPERL